MTIPAFALQLERGHHRLPCPQCNRGKRDTALSVDVRYDGGVFFCFRCSYAGGWSDTAGRITSFGAPSPRRDHEAPRLGLSPVAMALWKSTVAVSGAGADYLVARGCELPPERSHLRYLPSARHPSGHVGPCLVGLVTHATSGDPLTLHRTWVRPDGRKADVERPRLLLKNHPKALGVIRLWPESEINGALGVAEGVETALSAAGYFRPMWSAIDAGNMATLPILPGITSLFIVADHDDAGVRAAHACAARWTEVGSAEVRVFVPPKRGTDFNDLVREVGA